MAVKKIAITTRWNYHNYGSALQVVASYEILKSLGYDPDIVNYIPSGKKYSTTSEADRAHEESYAKYPRVIDKDRDKKFEDYLDSHLTFTQKVQNEDEFDKLNDKYSAFIAGSDQIWAPRVFDERYFLNYVRDRRKKIAYAPSIGLPSIENEYVKSKMRDLILQFAHISVRERQGAELIRSSFNIDDVEVMPDPTLLLTYEEWRKIIPKHNKIEGDKYILCYFLGENEKVWEHVAEVSDQTGLAVKILPILEKDAKYGKLVEGVGPEEFFNLLDDADIVLTDSFHGAIFSVITRTPFYVFERFDNKSNGSQNSRVYNLLEMLGMENRLIKYGDSVKQKYNFKINFNNAYKVIKKQKNRAIAWLSRALYNAHEAETVKMDALITYYSHSIEKSLSNPNFERGHAFSVAKELVNLLQQYSNLKFDKNSPAYRSAVDNLNELYLRHKDSKYKNDVKGMVASFLEGSTDDAIKIGGSLTMRISEKQNNSTKNFKELSSGRHSVRDYLDKQVNEEDIREVIEIAQKSPSACNRQQARVYYMTDKKVISEILGIQGTLKDYPTPPLLFLITATDDAYILDTENNNGYIDGSLFAMSLLYALEYKGIGACPLHTMFTDEVRTRVMSMLNIPENEKLIFFISAGYFSEQILACRSFRYPIEYVSRKITRLSPSDSSRKTIKNILTPEQIEIENLHAENVRLTTELNSFLSTKRSARLLAGNIKRHYARGSIGKLKRAVRVRTRIREVLPVLKNVWNRTYWLLKNIKIRRNVNKIAQEHLTRGNKIPKVIHYIWVGGAKKPESVEKYIATWREHCPDYEIIEWNEQNYNIQLNRYAREAYSAKKWAFVTDYMRLDILDQFGGIYMDSDVEVLKNLDDFLKDSAFSSFEAGDPSQIFMPTGMMASEKGGVWVRYLKSYYSPHKSFFRTNGEIDDTPNTVTITRMTVDKYGVKLNNKLQKFDDFTIYPSEYFCPKSWSTREINITKNTHTIHHFAASWLPPEIRKLQHEGEE